MDPAQNRWGHCSDQKSTPDCPFFRIELILDFSTAITFYLGYLSSAIFTASFRFFMRCLVVQYSSFAAPYSNFLCAALGKLGSICLAQSYSLSELKTIVLLDVVTVHDTSSLALWPQFPATLIVMPASG